MSQSLDENGKVLKGEMIDLSKADDLVQKVLDAQANGAASFVIGKFPEKGDVVTINGLKFKVLDSMPINGRIYLQFIIAE